MEAAAIPASCAAALSPAGLVPAGSLFNEAEGALRGVPAQTAVYAALIPIDAIGGQVGGHTTKRTVH